MWFFFLLCLVAQSCLTLCNSMDCIPPGSSVHGNSPGKNVKSGLPCPPSGNLPNPGSNPGLLCPPGPDPDVSWVSLASHPPVCRSSLRGVCMEGAGRASASKRGSYHKDIISLWPPLPTSLSQILLRSWPARKQLDSLLLKALPKPCAPLL